MKVPFGDPWPGVDSVSLRDGVAAGAVNCYQNEAKHYRKVPGQKAFATHGDARPWPALYETLSGVLLGVTNGKVIKIAADATLTAFTGDTVTADASSTWTEDGQHVYLAHGGKLARLDMTNLTVELLNENTPSAVTHVCRSKGFLLTNGNDVVVASSAFQIAQVFDTASSLDAVVVLGDKPGWIVATGRSTATPTNQGRIYLSKDNGLTWTKAHTLGSASNSFILALEYMGGGVVLAGTGLATGRILRSTDYGATWGDLGQQGSSTKINFIRKLTSTVAIAGAGSGTSLGRVFRSSNTGLTWTDIGTDFGKQVSDGEPLTASGATVAIGTISNADAFVVYRSTDTGAAFTSVQTLTSAGYIPAIQRISDTVAILSNGVIANAQKVWRSTDAGLTWVLQAPIPDFPNACIPMAFWQLADGELLMATAGDAVSTGGAQIWKSNDQGVTWFLVAELNSTSTAAIEQRGLKETHIAGTVIATGRVDLGNDGTSTAAKWQTGLGRNAPQGDVFFSEDFVSGYEAVDSWERFNAEQVPDGVNALFAQSSLVYACGPRSIEINQNVADPDNPWAFSDPALEFGVLAPFSVVSWKSVKDDVPTVMYLTDTDGPVQVVQFRGRTQHPVSPQYAAILNDRTLVSNPAAAKAWGVVMRGIPHYVLSFQADNLTICYNLAQDHWWRWGYWNGTTFEAALINSYCYSRAQKKHFIGDRRANGRLYTLEGLTDDGTAIRFELTSGHITHGGFFPKPVGRYLYQVQRGGAQDSSTPVFTHEVRDDNRPSFGTARQISLGVAGDTEFLGHSNRWGCYRARQHRIVHQDTQSDFVFAELDES